MELQEGLLKFNGDIELNGHRVKTSGIDTVGDVNMEMKRNTISMVELQDNLTVLNTKTECLNNIVCDTFAGRNSTTSTILNHIMNESTSEFKFYVGSSTVPDATTDLVMTLQNNLITFHRPTSPDIGGGGVDDTNLVKYTGETLQTIEGDVVGTRRIDGRVPFTISQHFPGFWHEVDTTSTRVCGWGGVGHVNVPCKLHTLLMFRTCQDVGQGLGWGGAC